jgi:hypothetical protein
MFRSRHRVTVFAAIVPSLLMCTALFAQVPGPDADREELIELGRQQGSAEALFNYFKQQADGGQPLTSETLPDWKGVYSLRFGPAGLAYDTAQTDPRGLAPAKLKPEYQAKLEERVAQRNAGIEFDPLGRCEPPGAPRGVSEPFLREYAVTPEQTWLMNEVGPEIRRVYTDGREHLPESDRFPTFDGDSIGFWSNGALVIHTNQLRAGMYQRGQPDYSDQIELVEIMQKKDENTLIAHIWAFDPVVLEEPWYTRKEYVRLTDPDKALRIHFWYCFDNQNNDVEEQDDGSTTFTDFSFD